MTQLIGAALMYPAALHGYYVITQAASIKLPDQGSVVARAHKIAGDIFKLVASMMMFKAVVASSIHLLAGNTLAASISAVTPWVIGFIFTNNLGIVFSATWLSLYRPSPY